MSKFQSEAKYRRLIEESPLGIEIYRADGMLQHVNKAWERIWHAKAEDVVGKYNPLEVEQLEEKGVLHLIKKSFAGEQVIIPDIEFDPTASNLPGRKRWLRTNVYHTTAPDGSLENVVVITQDITEQKEAQVQQSILLDAEKRRRQEAETLRTVTAALSKTLNLNQLLNLILAQLANVLAYDSSAIFLYEPDNLRGMACRGLNYPQKVLDQHFPVDDALFQYVLKQRRPVWLANVGQDVRFHGWGGTQGVQSWIGVPLMARGNFIGYMTIDSYRDNAYGPEEAALVAPFAAQAAQAIENARLYDQVQTHADNLEAAMAQLKETQQQLIQQERLAAVGQLAAGIAHDFNNILAVIVLYSQLLQRTAQPTTLDTNRLQTIVDQADRATKLVQQILDFSRKSMIEKRPLFLPDFLKEMQTLLSRMLPETILITVQTPPDIANVLVDATSMQQLLINLSVNARDAMPDGGTLQIVAMPLEITTGQTPPLPQMNHGKWVMIHVQDNGVGMPDAVREKVFEPFFTTKPPGQGTGLGLAQAYGIVRQHDGFITCASESGVGTLFTIYLPAHLSAVEEPIQLTDDVPMGNGELILVVEDNHSTLTVIVEILSLLNYTVITAQNGNQAIEQLSTHLEVKVVLSDVVMPDMGGYELLHRIKNDYAHINLIMMSGYTLSEKISPLVAQKGVSWMRKPFSLDALAQAMSKAVKKE